MKNRYFIVGGGVSLRDVDLESLKDQGTFIACNNAYKICPWAKAMVFADHLWAEWNLEHLLNNFENDIYCGAWTNTNIKYDKKVNMLDNLGYYGLTLEKGKIRGNNCGQIACNLAVQMGAEEIILLGFDMKATNGECQWHNEHKRPTNTSVYDNHMIPAFKSFKNDVDILDIMVYNANKNSGMRLFPFVDIYDGEIIYADNEEKQGRCGKEG